MKNLFHELNDNVLLKSIKVYEEKICYATFLLGGLLLMCQQEVFVEIIGNWSFIKKV